MANQIFPLGYDVSVTYRTVALEYPDGSTRVVTAFQSALDQAEVSGRVCLAEGCARRLVSPRQSLVDVEVPSTTANYGTDLTENLNADLDPRGLAMVSAGVDAELRKDERVVRSVTNAALIGDLLMVPINLFDAAGPFKLVLSIGSVNVAILSAPS